MTAHLLIVEDDENLGAGLAYNLERAGFEVTRATTAAAGIEALAAGGIELVLLDLMLPDRSGFDVLEQIRGEGRSLPVIVLSALGEELDKLRGFDLGASDYVTKPFSVAELLARIHARLSGDRPRSQVRLGDVELDLERFVVRRDGREERLTQTEVALLRLLLEDVGQPVERERIVRSIWNLGSFGTRTLDTHIARLRKKLEADPSRPELLRTVHGVGYQLHRERGGSA